MEVTPYNLKHLNQNGTLFLGPIHDDEAVILYGITRTLVNKNILELGGLQGYSARNFLAAGGKVTTMDLSPVVAINASHRVITDDCRYASQYITTALGLVLFDAHDFEAETTAFDSLVESGGITRDTLIVVHDTGYHPEKLVEDAIETAKGWLHNLPAHQLLTYMKDAGCHDVFIPSVHGLSLLRLP